MISSMKTADSLIAERLATLPITEAERARALKGEAIGDLFLVLADLFADLSSRSKRWR